MTTISTEVRDALGAAPYSMPPDRARRHPVMLMPARPDPLHIRAARLWPDSEALQREWLRAVRVVRATSGGWLLDSRQPPIRSKQ